MGFTPILLIIFVISASDALTSSKTANYVYAAPNGSAGTPGFRKLVAADIPSLAAGKITSGTLEAARLPISTTQTNSTTNIPSSSLVYSMQTKIDELSNALPKSNTETKTFSIPSSTYYVPCEIPMTFVVAYSPISITSYSFSYSKTSWTKSVKEMYSKGNTIYVTVSVTGGSGYMSGTATMTATYSYIA